MLIDAKGHILDTNNILRITPVKEEKSYNSPTIIPIYKFDIYFTCSGLVCLSWEAKDIFMEEDSTNTEAKFSTVITNEDRLFFAAIAKKQCENMRNAIIDVWASKKNSFELLIL